MEHEKQTDVRTEPTQKHNIESEHADVCILCGNLVPEGRVVCPACEKRYLLDLR